MLANNFQNLNSSVKIKIKALTDWQTIMVLFAILTVSLLICVAASTEIFHFTEFKNNSKGSMLEKNS